jgi:hypothetical protein
MEFDRRGKAVAAEQKQEHQRGRSAVQAGSILGPNLRQQVSQIMRLPLTSNY